MSSPASSCCGTWTRLHRAPPADTDPEARSGQLEWPKRVLQQTNLVSSIADEIELNINRADWDADCYEGCRKLLLRETQRMETVSDDRGPGEIPVLVEVQHWVDEALENSTRATERILGRVASMGVHHSDLDREEAGDFDLTDSKVAQAVMRAVTAYPLNNAQLERIVRLAPGKRVLDASTTTTGRDPPQATTSAFGPASGHQAGPEVMSEDGDESHGTDCTGPEGPPLASRVVQPTPPRSMEAAALKPSEAPAVQPPEGNPSIKTVVTAPGEKKKSRVARRAAREAVGVSDGTPIAESDQVPLCERPRQCPVFGCTREHTPGDCPTFLDMTPKERLDMVHAKQLCLLCLQHPLSVGCEVAGKGFCCPAEGCDRPYHATLHGVLKAVGSSPPEGNADPPDKPAVLVDCGTPEAARQLRGLLEGLGIDPNALEIRIGVRQPGEPGRPRGSDTTGPGAAEAGVRRLTGRLMEALTSLCQAGERFVDSAAEGGQWMIGVEDPAGIPKRSAREDRSRSATRNAECTPWRDSDWMERQEPDRQEREDDIGMISERHRALESSEYVRGDQGSLERYGGLPRVVLLTPEGGQLINKGIGRGFVFSVISQKTAARYAVHRSKLLAPVMVAGPAGHQVGATEHCTMAFPQEKAVGGKLIIYAFVVDMLEELYETPDGGLQRWQMQLGEEDEGYLRWLRVAQPGDRPFCELSLEEVTLDPERVSRSTWKFLVCKGRQMTETVWLTAVRAWNMPMSRLSADAATRLGLRERPNDWCQVRQCHGAAGGRISRQNCECVRDRPPRVSDGKEAARAELPQAGRGDRHQGLGDCGEVSLQCGAGQDGWAEGETRKHHVRIVLQGGERWYLNLLVSETARQSRIISAAAAKLGRGSVHDKRMHLRDVNGMEVSILVDVVDTMKELLEGEDSFRGSPKPHMVLSLGDERRIKGIMLTGWMGQADLLKGWASQGNKKGQPTPEAGEQASLKHLKVKTEGQDMRISALFDKDVPNTMIGYGAAAILGLKGSRTRCWVATKEGNRGMSFAWYEVPLKDMNGRVTPKGGCPVKGTGDPGDYIKVEAGNPVGRN
jgi:hypothetical protein